MSIILSYPFRRKFLFSSFSSILFLTSQAFSATYYFSSKTGDDSHTAAQAQNVSTPWKTLSKIQTLSLAAGDKILLENGGEYPGTLTLGPTAIGENGNPITVSNYGTSSPDPILSGLKSVAGPWTIYPNKNPLLGSKSNIWVTKIPDTVEQVFWNSQSLTLARYPNLGSTPITKVIDPLHFQVKGFEGLDLSGATFFARTKHWTWDMQAINDFSAATGQINLSKSTIYPILVNWGIWINNSLGLLDTAGEWYWDAKAGNLYVYLPDGSDPNGQSISVSITGSGIVFNNCKQIVVENISLRGQGDDGIQGSGSNITLRHLGIENSLGSGISLDGANNSIEHCEIVGANVNGIDFYGVNGKIENNSVKKIAQISRLTSTGLAGECCTGRGINASGDDLLIKNNFLDSIGYVGIGFGGQRVKIDHNFIQHFLMTVDDGAAIYTWNDNFTHPGAAGSIISHNLILDAIGAPDGIPDQSTWAMGIYLDDRTHDITVDSNTVTGTDAGIFLHNCRNHILRGNICYGNRISQILLQPDNVADMFGIEMQNNILYSTTTGGMPYAEHRYGIDAGEVISHRTGDLDCQESFLQVHCERDGKLVWESPLIRTASDTAGKALIASHFTSSIEKWTTWPEPTITLTFDPTSDNPEHGGTLRIDGPNNPLNQGPLVVIPKNFQAKVGDKYFASYSLRSTSPLSLGIVPRLSHGDYTPVAKIFDFKTTTTWSNYSFPFEITKGDTSARLDFVWHHTQPVQFWIDDFSLYPLPPADPQAGALSSLYFNSDPSITKNIDPSPGGYWLNAEGIKQTGGKAINPLAGFIAIRGGRNLATALKPNLNSKKIKSPKKNLSVRTQHGQKNFLISKEIWSDLRGKKIKEVK